MPYNRLVFRVHAIQRMFQRQISEEDIRHVLAMGEIIESYPDDSPYPSFLALNFCGARPIHVVAADNHESQETIVITAYEPDPIQWDPSFRRRRTS
jgi:Domain of unknown function (DUF4258)